MPIYQVTQEVDGQQIQIYVEMDAATKAKGLYDDVRGVGDTAQKVIAATRDVFSAGIGLARDCATLVVHGIEQMDEKTRPDEFGVQFAIKLDSELGAMIVKMGTEAQLQVTMTWKRQA